MTERADTLGAVGGFVRSELAPPDLPLGDDASLIDSQVLDSIALVRLVVFIERTFGIRVDDRDVLPRNFGSIRSIAGLIDSRLGR